VVYPAAFKGALGIGSTDADDDRSTFSNYATPSVEMAAPGEALVTTYPGNNYAGVWGTSFSTALTSGAAALLVQLEPQVSSNHAFNVLEHGHRFNSDNMGLGYGRLDVYASLLYHLTRMNN
jgi:subtilisin family serine protease